MVFALTLGCVTQQSEVAPLNPTTANIQRWVTTCVAYRDVLTAMNDGLEVGSILKDDLIVSQFKLIKTSLHSACVSETPPNVVDMGEFQEMLANHLLLLMKITRGIPV